MTVQITSTYDAIVDSLAGEIPAEQGLLQQKVRYVTRNFLMQTEVWQYDTDPIDTVAAQQIYDLPIPYNAIAKSIVKVWWGNPASKFSPPSNISGYRLNDINKIELMAKQVDAVTAEMIVRVSLFPQWDSYDTPVSVVERWAEAIRYGVKSEMFNDMSKPWANKQYALEMQIQYRSKVAEAITQWTSNGVVRRETMTGWAVL